MLFLFGKKKNQKAAGQNEVQDNTPGIADTCIKCQRYLAFLLQTKSERLSVRSKAILLMLFSVLTAGYSVYLLSVSFSGRQFLSFSVTAVTKPAYIGKPGNINSKPPAVITLREYQRIHRFKQYMERLGRSPTGKREYDSIAAFRPGLLDTIVFIENMYQTQTKK